MEKPLFGFSLPCFFLISFGIISFVLCISAEFKKTKINKDLRIDGELCFLPQSHSFGLGIASLVCFFVALIIGLFIIIWENYKKSCLEEFVGNGGGWKWKATKPSTSTVFLSLSWMSFGIVVILIGTASSMSQRQDNGEGWVDGECYIVKDGVYGGSGILVLISVTSTLVSCILTMKKKSRVEQGQKIHAAQVV